MSSTNPISIRVLIIDDHQIIRKAFVNALSAEKDFQIVAETDNGESALLLARSVQPDVIIMDVGFPKMMGIDIARKILAENPKIKVIGMSLYDDTEMIQQIKDAGVIAYFNKGNAFERIFEIIRNTVCKY